MTLQQGAVPRLTSHYHSFHGVIHAEFVLNFFFISSFFQAIYYIKGLKIISDLLRCIHPFTKSQSLQKTKLHIIKSHCKASKEMVVDQFVDYAATYVVKTLSLCCILQLYTNLYKQVSVLHSLKM
jgi:hypothetical protein